MKRLLPLLLVATLPGCLAVPFGYPTWSHAPALKLNACEDEVFVLKVKRRVQYLVVAMGAAEPPSATIVSLERMAGDRLFEGHDSLGVTYGFAGIHFFPMTWLLPLPLWKSTHLSEEVWLYRPGYQVVVLPDLLTWHQIEWRPATSLKERGEALAKVTMGADLSADGSVVDSIYRDYKTLLVQEWKKLKHEHDLSPEKDGALNNRLDMYRYWWLPSSAEDAEFIRAAAAGSLLDSESQPRRD